MGAEHAVAVAQCRDGPLLSHHEVPHRELGDDLERHEDHNQRGDREQRDDDSHGDAYAERLRRREDGEDDAGERSTDDDQEAEGDDDQQHGPSEHPPEGSRAGLPGGLEAALRLSRSS